MLKLKYLFDQRDLAMMLLGNWHYDSDSVDLMNHFRISSNAIYPFRRDNQVCFLRFSPNEEKPLYAIQAEIDCIQFLREKQYPALEPIPSKNHQLVMQQNTPWGVYNASAFYRVQGDRLDTVPITDELLFSSGQTLGKLHALSHNYTDTQGRWSHQGVFQWMEEYLKIHTQEKGVLKKLLELQKQFSTLPRTRQNYGLIHYDFEPDNLFVEKDSTTVSVIDFDDCHHNFFVMDILQAWNEFSDSFSEASHNEKRALFLAGYEKEYAVDPHVWERSSILVEFASLYSFVRIHRCLDEKWDNEPDWMIALREKLQSKIDWLRTTLMNTKDNCEKS